MPEPVIAAAAPSELTAEVYRELFLRSNDAIALLDLEGRYLEQNEAHHALLGYSDHELANQTPAIHMGEEPFADIARVLRDVGRFRGDVLSRARSGQLLHLDLAAFVIMGPDGRPLLYAGIKRDMTAHRRDRSELQRRFDQLHTAYQLTKALGQSLPLTAIYDEALSALETHVKAHRAAILLFDPDGVMRFKAWRGLSDGYRAAVEGHSPWRPDTRDPQPVVVADVDQEPSLQALASMIRGEGIRAMTFIPLVAETRLLGKFMVYFEEPHVFSQDDLRLAQNIGDHIALAIARKRRDDHIAHLNDALTERVREYERVVQELQRSQAALQQKVEDLEQFEQVVIGRELKMIELEKEIDDLRNGHPRRPQR